MAKYAALVILALVSVCAASPMGWGLGMKGVVSKNHHVSSQHIISPYMGLGLGYGMMGLGHIGHMGGIGHLGGIGHGIGHSVSSHSSVGHVMHPHLGLGHHMGHMGMKGLYGMYPGGIGLGYGLMG